jgi:hypothetical protein
VTIMVHINKNAAVSEVSFVLFSWWMVKVEGRRKVARGSDSSNNSVLRSSTT